MENGGRRSATESDVQSMFLNIKVTKLVEIVTIAHNHMGSYNSVFFFFSFF